MVGTLIIADAEAAVPKSERETRQRILPPTKPGVFRASRINRQ
jgi:hypothetical protein